MNQRSWQAFQKTHAIFVLTCVSSRDFIYLSGYNGRQMGLDFTCFGVGGEGLQETMRAEVCTTSPCTTDSCKMEFLKVFTSTGIITQHTARKDPKF